MLTVHYGLNLVIDDAGNCEVVLFRLRLNQRNLPSSEINGCFQSCWQSYFIIHMTKQTINLTAMYGNGGNEQISYE